MQRVYWIIISSIILAFSANAQVFDSGLSEAQKNHVLPSARAVQDDKTFENAKFHENKIFMELNFTENKKSLEQFSNTF